MSKTIMSYFKDEDVRVLPVSVRGGIFLLPRLVMRRIKPTDRLLRSVVHGSSRAAIAQDT